jgi:3-deoxy-D-manno-octulosonate 8-phosphate phosphatase KdsC-like HAD superfamily phosphatase
VDWVSPSPGGRGAVRELIELVLHAQGRWEGLVRDLASGALQAAVLASERRT